MMACHLPIYGGRPAQIVAYAVVDADAHPRVAGYRWWMQGTPETPRSIFRPLTSAERQAGESRDRSLTREILQEPGRVTFRNGDGLDHRGANLLHAPQWAIQQAAAAQQLRQTTFRGHALDTAPPVVLPLTSGWTVTVDATWAARLGAYA